MRKLKDFTKNGLVQKNDKTGLNHIFNDNDCHALWSAYAAGRPLLVRGKPGTGKSQMARAIADRLGWTLVSEVVRGNTELSDLHWNFDAIRRLGEAQVQRPQNNPQNKSKDDPLDPKWFLSPGAFWWAYDWETANQQFEDCTYNLRQKPDEKPGSKGVVLLIDEIDKAEPDLPNGLLETLGNYEFSVPYLSQTSDKDNTNTIKGEKHNLLIIITTNEERELPTAFVRRCFVHTLKMEENIDWLVRRGQLHYGQEITDTVYKNAAQQLLSDRSRAKDGRYPPGLAEYIDLLGALATVELTEQADLLEKVSAYALQKEVKR